MIVKFTGVQEDVYINTTYITSVVALNKYVVVDFVGGGSKSICVKDNEEAIKKTKSLAGLMDPAQLSNSASGFREV